MAVGAEVRKKIVSIKSTQKITRAMELVAASKMRKAQERMTVSKPYARKMRQVISHLAGAHSEYHHKYLESRDEINNIGIIVVSTDRGLCGGLNVNLFKNILSKMKQVDDKGGRIDLCTIGLKSEVYFRRFGGTIAATASHLGDSPSVEDLIGIVKVMLDRFENGEIDALYLASNEFINTMTQNPQIEQLLPLEFIEGESNVTRWDYIYEPEAKGLLDALLVRYIETQVYQAVIENNACEQAARMVAMKSASDNAGDLIADLQKVYNKARQAAITQEISEIVSGAGAV